MEKLRQVPVLALCHDQYLYRTDPNTYGQLHPRAWQQLRQVIREQGYGADEVRLGGEGRLAIGMSLCGLYAAKGRPVFQHITETHKSRLERNDYADGSRVYMLDGRVIRWTRQQSDHD